MKNKLVFFLSLGPLLLSASLLFVLMAFCSRAPEDELRVLLGSFGGIVCECGGAVNCCALALHGSREH